ncbi:MAG: hypothetical protein WAK55_21380 [Xanthobacteraceae bacterium]
MNRGRAASLQFGLALLILAAADRAAWAQFGPPQGAPGAPGSPGGQASQCNTFPALAAEAQKRGAAVGAAIKAKADRKQICTLMTTFVAAETIVIKFLDENKVWCGVPDQVLTVSKANHEKSLKFRTDACNEDGPHPKAPSLSDAIKEPSGVDTAKNTKTGRGTFDTLTGNPLSK